MQSSPGGPLKADIQREMAIVCTFKMRARSKMLPEKRLYKLLMQKMIVILAARTGNGLTPVFS